MVISQLLREYREGSAFADLTAQVEAGGQTGKEAGSDILSSYAPLFERNQDMFGWIRIENTVLNYPVMYTPEEPERYLHRDFDKNSSSSGVPFLDGNCFESCGNYLIYGHNMKNGTMFASLLSYAGKDYWEEHPIIYFDTLSETGTYQVIASFYSRVYSADETNVFRYYEYTNLTDPDIFEEYVRQVKAAALYDTGIDVEYGTDLLTLSTCEYSAENGRFVVVAKKAETNGQE